MHNQWGGSFEITGEQHAADEEEESRNADWDRGALSRRKHLDEMQRSWLLEPEDPDQIKKDKYIDLGCVVCKRKVFRLTVIFFVAVLLFIALPVTIVKSLPKHKAAPPQPDHYSEALHKALMFFNAQKAGWLPKNNGVPWRGNSGIHDGSTLPDVKGGLVGGYYDSGDNIKFHFPMAFSMTLLSWTVIEYGHKYKSLGEYDHVRDIIRWGTDYLLLTFNNTAGSKLTHVYSQVGAAKNVSTEADDHYCWMRPEDMDYPRPVQTTTSGPDLGSEMAAALAAASIVFRNDDRAYSEKLLRGASTIYSFARNPSKRTRYSRGVSTTEPFYNSTGYYDDYMWGSAWMFYATGNTSYLSLATHPSLTKNARAFKRMLANKVFGWDNKLPGAELLLTRLRIFLGPPYPYEDSLNLYHNTTGLNMCSYLPDFRTFNYTPGGLLRLDLGRPKPLQYVVNAAFLASLYADYMDAIDIPGYYCGSYYFSSSILRQFAKSQVDYILGDNPRKMSYVVGHGTRYPRHVHHRAASMPRDGRKYSCKGGWKWRDARTPDPNVVVGAMVAGPDRSDRFSDVRTNPNYTEPTLAGNAGLVAALVSLTSSGGGSGVDKNSIFSSVRPFYPSSPPPPAPWQP